MVHDLIAEARRQAEKLDRYRVKPAGCVFLLWRYDHGWIAVHQFPSDEAAEAYLHARLDQIPDTPGDLRRTP